jgi:ethanolamine ammonia-lyase small subunit
MSQPDPPVSLPTQMQTQMQTPALPSPVTPNPWQALRRYTDARIALGRAGVSLPTQPHLAFQLAHAQARDAVHLALDVPALHAELDRLAAAAGLGDTSLILHSAAADRDRYLQRPDLGRRLSAASRELLLARLPGAHVELLSRTDAAHDTPEQRRVDIAFVVADGLSPLAIASHAAPLLGRILPTLMAQGWSVAPLSVVSQGRVAVADEIGQLLQARLVVILIGERPGLSSPDSLGLYLTWMPRVGLSDASRNCISNVRPAGLQFDAAARTLLDLLGAARQRRLSGVDLKDEAPVAPDLAHPAPTLAAAGPLATGKPASAGADTR